MKKTKKAWAIDTDAEHGFIGAYWFQFANGIPACMKGSTIALWPTRAAAKESLPFVKGSREHGKFPHAKVVRVQVTIETVAAEEPAK